MKLDERLWRAIKGPLQWRVIWYAHSRYNVAVHALVRDDRGRVLLVRNRMWPIGKQTGAPGGYAASGEDFHDSAAREVAEETGYVIKCVGEPVRVRSGLKLRVEMWYLAELVGGELRLDPKEILSAGLFDFDVLPLDLHPGHRAVVEAHRGWFAPREQRPRAD